MAVFTWSPEGKAKVTDWETLTRLCWGFPVLSDDGDVDRVIKPSLLFSGIHDGDVEDDGDSDVSNYKDDHYFALFLNLHSMDFEKELGLPGRAFYAVPLRDFSKERWKKFEEVIVEDCDSIEESGIVVEDGPNIPIVTEGL